MCATALHSAPQGARGKTTKLITQLHEAWTWLPVTAGADAMGRLKAGPWGPRAKAAARNQIRASGKGEPARAHLWAKVVGTVVINGPGQRELYWAHLPLP